MLDHGNDHAKGPALTRSADSPRRVKLGHRTAPAPRGHAARHLTRRVRASERVSRAGPLALVRRGYESAMALSLFGQASRVEDVKG